MQAGFPYFQLDRFLKTLVQELEQHVAISEEVPNATSTKGKPGALLFDRQVCRIITPGTLIDERFMNTSESNYLLAIYFDGAHNAVSSSVPHKSERDGGLMSKDVGLAWLDLSTGDFHTQCTEIASLRSAMARIGPKEVILNKTSQPLAGTAPDSMMLEYRHIISHHDPPSLIPAATAWNAFLEQPLSHAEAASFTNAERGAGAILLDYVKEQLQGLQTKLQAPIRRRDSEIMTIDRNSMRALEIKSTLKDGLVKGSLLHAMQRTVTSSGARLLSEWLTAPSTSLPVINGRLDLVAFLLQSEDLREEITRSLSRSYDSQRLVQKFSFGRGDPEDLISLYRTILAADEISVRLSESSKEWKSSTPARENTDGMLGFGCLGTILSRLDLNGPASLAQRISEAIDEEGLMRKQRLHEDETANVIAMAQGVAAAQGVQLNPARGPKGERQKDSIMSSQPDADDVWVMKKTASDTLARLHSQFEGLHEEKKRLELELRARHDASSLTLRWTPGLGHICHVKGKDTKSSLSLSDQVRSVSASKSTRSFHLPEWTELGLRIDQAKLQIRSEEQAVFRELRNEVIANIGKLRSNAAVLDELDIACAFARLAHERAFVRPVITTSTVHKVVGGRHPTVEGGLETEGRTFIANDCFVGGQQRIWLITGPNMAGKSTFLRQNALISIMAQAGSFVPADYAEIGIVDRMFSRIGSADNLYQDQSTFMIEMLETATILKQATPRSFVRLHPTCTQQSLTISQVIMDEVGRGTTSEDGVAVAYACIDHLYHVNQCRTLFATHFHALADMTASMESVACFCTDVAEGASGSFSYVHRLRPGVNRQSHALKVARLAGSLPLAAHSVSSFTDIQQGFPKGLLPRRLVYFMEGPKRPRPTRGTNRDSGEMQ